jgi:hypothetical protein
VERNIAGGHYSWLMKIREFMKNHVDNEKFSTRSVYDASVLLSNGFSKKDVLTSISSHWDETLQQQLLYHLS